MGITEIKPFLTDAFYYKHNSFEGGIFAKEACDNLDYLESIVAILNKPISFIQDIYLCFWSLSFKEFAADIGSFEIDESIKTKVVNLSDLITPDYVSLIKYINKNYLDVFNKQKHENNKWYSFFDFAFDVFYGKYSKGINENVFRFFEEKHGDYILCHYNSCSKYYSKHRESFKTLFRNLKNTRVFDDQLYLRFLINSYSSNDPFLNEQAKFICDRTIHEVQAMELNDDNQDCVQILMLLQDYWRLANLYRLTCANDYNVFMKKLREKVDAFIMKHGIHHQIGPVDLTPLVDMLKANKDQYKFIGLTREPNGKGGSRNCLDYILTLDNKRNPLSEVMNDPSRNRSKKYPYYKQDSMRITLWVRTGLINRVLKDEVLLREFQNYLNVILSTIQRDYFYNLIDIEKEVTGELESLLAMHELARRSKFESPYGKTLIYGTSMAICSSIEKIMRNVVLQENRNNVFIDLSKAALSDLLKILSPNPIFSEGLKYFLEFYLIKELSFNGKELDRPGLNIRNALMHGQDEVYATIDYGTCLTLFYFLLSILNDLIIALGAKGK